MRSGDRRTERGILAAAAVAAALLAAPALGQEPADGEQAPAANPPGEGMRSRLAATTLSLLVGSTLTWSNEADGMREGQPDPGFELLAVVSPAHLSFGLGGGYAEVWHARRSWISLLGGLGTFVGRWARLDLLGELGRESFSMAKQSGDWNSYSITGGKATLDYCGARFQVTARPWAPWAVGLALFARRTMGHATADYTEHQCQFLGPCTDNPSTIRYGGMGAGVSLVVGAVLGGPR